MRIETSWANNLLVHSTGRHVLNRPYPGKIEVLMYKKLFGVLLGVFVIWGSTVAFGQCGASIKRTFQTCGGHCGSVIMLTYQGVGSACQDGTGELGFGCCGLMLFEPGSCGGASRPLQPNELVSSQEFMALKDALVLRKRILQGVSYPTIASCAANKNAFNEWLQAKLKQQRVGQ